MSACDNNCSITTMQTFAYIVSKFLALFLPLVFIFAIPLPQVKQKILKPKAKKLKTKKITKIVT